MDTIRLIKGPHPDGSLIRSAPRDMVQKRKEALAALRELGGLKDVIPDPTAWQREQRAESSIWGKE